MATIHKLKEFAEKMAACERILRDSGVTGDPGRVVFVLTMANARNGTTQKEVNHSMHLRADVVSKLVRGLVDAGLLVGEKDGLNTRSKRLRITVRGEALLGQVTACIGARRTETPPRVERWRQTELSEFPIVAETQQSRAEEISSPGDGMSTHARSRRKIDRAGKHLGD